ncbi:hypothetical protein FACS189493_1810 [Spirochaetia bacterium]|nr:hypothetical protein FACS189493_1810 [Spirochaetia bacterium]
MPAQILHTLFGEDVIAALDSRIGRRFDIARHRTAFVLGCQGPDIFLHSQMRRPVALEYGTLLHRRGFGAFAAALLEAALPIAASQTASGTALEHGISRHRNPLEAYALGFTTHAFLDREAHPYIVYKTAEPERRDIRTGRRHAFFERLLDVLMLRCLRGRPVSSWDQEAELVAVCAAPPPALKALLAETLIRTFPERAGKDSKLRSRIDNAFLDCAAFYRSTDPRVTALDTFSPASGDRPSPPLALVYPEQFPLKADYLNLEHRPWCDPAPGGREDTRSFPEIYSDAVNKAADTLTPILTRYWETGVFPTAEAERSIGNGGLSIRDAAGKPCAPARAQALPLEEVLAEQAALRAERE